MKCSFRPTPRAIYSSWAIGTGFRRVANVSRWWPDIILSRLRREERIIINHSSLYLFIILSSSHHSPLYSHSPNPPTPPLPLSSSSWPHSCSIKRNECGQEGGESQINGQNSGFSLGWVDVIRRSRLKITVSVYRVNNRGSNRGLRGVYQTEIEK